jgi:hypothetical protein
VVSARPKTNHTIDVDQAERERPSLAAKEPANTTDPPPSRAISQHQVVPIFRDNDSAPHDTLTHTVTGESIVVRGEFSES